MYFRSFKVSTILLNNFNSNLINKKCQSEFKRTLTTKLVFNEYGQPNEVVGKITENRPPEPSKNEVLVEILASPVNPVDINIIQGKYPVKKEFPAVAGSEGVGRVIQLGEGVKRFKVGDHVIPLAYNTGTWTTHKVYSENILKTVPKNLAPAEASILMTNPCTAYRMLKDFVNLKEGDFIIQNGANSSCGVLTLQLCKLWGINSVNVVRTRQNIDELKKHLKNLGATYVLTEEELKDTDLFKSGAVSKPKLALNCVGGDSSSQLLKTLDQNGVLVTYGGMSMQPVTLPVSALIFRNIKVLGFSVNIWNNNCDTNERDSMLDELVSLFLNSKLKIPSYQLVALDDFKTVLSEGLRSKTGKKYIFEINKV